MFHHPKAEPSQPLLPLPSSSIVHLIYLKIIDIWKLVANIVKNCEVNLLNYNYLIKLFVKVINKYKMSEKEMLI